MNKSYRTAESQNINLIGTYTKQYEVLTTSLSFNLTFNPYKPSGLNM